MGFLYLDFKDIMCIHVSKGDGVIPQKQSCGQRCAPVDSQFDYDGAGFDLVHFHEGETFCAGEPLFRFVVLEFKEDSCSWKNGGQSLDHCFGKMNFCTPSRSLQDPMTLIH